MDSKEMLKEAKSTQEKVKQPDGYIYSIVNGKKEFHAIDKVLVSKAEMTVEGLVDYIFKLNGRIEKLKEVNTQMIEKIIELEKKVNLWIG